MEIEKQQQNNDLVESAKDVIQGKEEKKIVEEEQKKKLISGIFENGIKKIETSINGLKDFVLNNQPKFPNEISVKELKQQKKPIEVKGEVKVANQNREVEVLNFPEYPEPLDEISIKKPSWYKESEKVNNPNFDKQVFTIKFDKEARSPKYHSDVLKVKIDNVEDLKLTDFIPLDASTGRNQKNAIVELEKIVNSESALSAPATTALTLTTINTQYKMPASELAGRRLLVIYNVSDTSVYIGSSSVTTTTGILLEAGGVMTIDSEKDLYAVCGTAGKIINLLELL